MFHADQGADRNCFSKDASLRNQPHDGLCVVACTMRLHSCFRFCMFYVIQYWMLRDLRASTARHCTQGRHLSVVYSACFREAPINANMMQGTVDRCHTSTSFTQCNGQAFQNISQQYICRVVRLHKESSAAAGKQRDVAVCYCCQQSYLSW